MKRMVSDIKSEKLAQELKDLETRGDDELKNRWRRLYGTNPRRRFTTLSRSRRLPTVYGRVHWARSNLRSAAI